jgi:hypothetical protein
VGVLTKNILNKLALMGVAPRPHFLNPRKWGSDSKSIQPDLSAPAMTQTPAGLVLLARAPSTAVLGYFQPILSKLGFLREGGKPARLKLGFFQENQSQQGAFRHEWSMQYFFADFGGIFSG